jgi:hemoglobin
MKLTITKGTIGKRPSVTKPHPGFLAEVGKDRFHTLVYDHYELIKKSEIAFLFPVLDEEDFDEAKHHAFIFLLEVSGGEALFTKERGDHQMVGRHAPFRIDERGREVWLELYARLLEALADEGITDEYIQSFWDYLDIFSMWLVNTES